MVCESGCHTNSQGLQFEDICIECGFLGWAPGDGFVYPIPVLNGTRFSEGDYSDLSFLSQLIESPKRTRMNSLCSAWGVSAHDGAGCSARNWRIRAGSVNASSIESGQVGTSNIPRATLPRPGRGALAPPSWPSARFGTQQRRAAMQTCCFCVIDRPISGWANFNDITRGTKFS